MNANSRAGGRMAEHRLCPDIFVDDYARQRRTALGAVVKTLSEFTFTGDFGLIYVKLR